MSKKILVLGHRGMLGNAVVKYFTAQEGYEILTTKERWGTEAFNNELEGSLASYVINCIGAIPQKKISDEQFTDINYRLPVFLETLGKKIIHPTTDCEFSGNLASTKKYSKQDTRDALDAYGKSKASISLLIETKFRNTKMIRTSIIGHELNSHVSLLDWFLSEESEVRGYTDHYWNGITTLQWAKLAKEMIDTWDECSALNQFASPETLSKYDILILAKEVYAKNTTIIPVTTGVVTNKCLETQKDLPSLKEQLEELKTFYNK